jgi:hypothetical protein
MNVKKLSLAIALAVAAFVGHANASILTFDTEANGQINPAYGGLTWDSNFYIYDTASYMSGYGNSYGATSGDKMAFNAFGVQSVTTTGSTFDFTGAQFTTWAAGDAHVWHSSSTITVEGWLAGTMVYSNTMALSATGFNWFAANYTGVDELRFLSDGASRWWLMDDFTINENNAVPVPASICLWGLGMGCAALVARRRKLAAKQ